MTSDLPSIFGLGIFAYFIGFVLYAGLIVLFFSITYTVIWRAVRRGLREFHYPNSSGR